MSSKMDELERLANLHERGALSNSEFAAAKASVLGSGEPLKRPQSDNSEAMPSIGNPVSDAGVSEDASHDFPMWAVFRPIRTHEDARSLLKAGYYAAVVASIQAVVFLSKAPVASDSDNVVLIVTLLIAVAAVFYAARKVSTQSSVIAAWCLLALVSCQLFGILTGAGFGFGFVALGIAGVIVGIQAVRATRAYRKADLKGGLGFADPST